MSGETRVDREALGQCLLRVMLHSGLPPNSGALALAQADAVLALFPAPHPQGGTLRDALDQIRVLATIHYMGGAFDPEHMREIANIAVDALLAAAPAPTEGDPYCICGGGADHDDDCPRADTAGEGVSGLRERDLRARLAAVTALHGHGGYFSDCRTCRGVRWPCPTVLAAAPAPTEAGSE